MSLARNSRDAFPPLPQSHLLRGNPGQKSGSRQVRSCVSCLLRPWQAGRRRGLGWVGGEGRLGRGAPGPRRSARLGQPLGLPGRVVGGSRPAGRPPGGGAPGASPARLPPLAAALRPRRPPREGTSPRGFTRVHTSRVERLEGAPVSPGCRPAGEEAQRSGRRSPGIPPLRGPALRARGVISLALLPRSGARRRGWQWRRRLARVPGPGTAPPPPPRDTRTGSGGHSPTRFDYFPARSSGGSRAGCAQGALVSDPTREGHGGVWSAWKVHASAGEHGKRPPLCQSSRHAAGSHRQSDCVDVG